MNWVKGSLGLFAAGWMAITVAQTQPAVEFGSANVTMAGQEYRVELATSFEQRAQGLMFREEMCTDCGMLFYFSPPKQASMWMRNTLIPLDVAFIDRNGVITDIKAMKPHDLTSVGASKVVTYALEMNQGWFDAHNISVGDQIEITMSENTGASQN